MQYISRLLSKSGIRSEAIHGNKSQNHRQRVLADFKSGKIRVMVATDIAARGIDIGNWRSSSITICRMCRKRTYTVSAAPVVPDIPEQPLRSAPRTSGRS